jgi:hypothetical protein
MVEVKEGDNLYVCHDGVLRTYLVQSIDGDWITVLAQFPMSFHASMINKIYMTTETAAVNKDRQNITRIITEYGVQIVALQEKIRNYQEIKDVLDKAAKKNRG